MRLLKLTFAVGLASAAACAAPAPPETSPTPTRDPRIGLDAGQYNAEKAVSNLRVLAEARPPAGFERSTSSDLAFRGNYAIQGNYNGILIWDISNPSAPTIVSSTVCPASQNDVSVFNNLLFVSTEGFNGRIDCGTQGFTRADSVSPLRHRGVRIFDISDIRNPKLIKNVQTCRGSHTHTVLADPDDRENIYVYVSGSFVVRSPSELPGCVSELNDPNTSLMRIEIIKVPLANPATAEIVGGARIFANLAAPPRHGPAPEDTVGYADRLAAAKARGEFTVIRDGREQILNPNFSRMLLDSLAKARGGTTPMAQDSAKLRAEMATIIAPYIGVPTGPDQCHDITVFPAVGLAGGACEGYGLLLDIRDPLNPIRIDAVADSNFSYWHSATFNNDATKILFSDEWGGGGSPKCRATDPKEWGANAIFTIGPDRRMHFQSYYKLPTVQTSVENCVAHNGSLIPIPDRDVMVQAWYQGGISVFDWTDPKHPYEIAFFDRGPVDSTRQGSGGAWSTYWYNGAIYTSEISRGFDALELTPSQHLTQNEIDAAKTVRFDQFNAQGQPMFSFPPSFPLAKAYVDQLERQQCVDSGRVTALRNGIAAAERASGGERRTALERVATDAQAAGGSCSAKLGKLAATARQVAGVQP